MVACAAAAATHEEEGAGEHVGVLGVDVDELRVLLCVYVCVRVCLRVYTCVFTCVYVCVCVQRLGRVTC